MKGFLEAVFIIGSIAGFVYGRAKLWSVLHPDQDYFPFLGPKEIQALFGDDNQTKLR
jgi:hypothetical protein